MTWMDELRKNLVDVKAELEMVDYSQFAALEKRVEKQEKRSKAIEESLRTMMGLLKLPSDEE